MRPVVLTFGGKRLVDSNGKAIFRYGIAEIGGKTYKTVKIGNMEWLAENLDWLPSGITLQTANLPTCSDPSAWRYTVASFECGLFYNCHAVPVINAALAGTGWRVAANADFVALGTAAGFSITPGETTYDDGLRKIMSVGYWQDNADNPKPGVDTYGFNLLPTSYKDDYASGPYAAGYVSSRIGMTTDLWSSSLSSYQDQPYRFYIDTDNRLTGTLTSYANTGGVAYNIRLVRELKQFYGE